ncbi:MAG: SDR family NAD(P)-dependent oxidoreductase, partial [Actinomycetota bacterium]|nr:SDR family NAD(P)-dependent oxidoreductase [Actinomycetota bacterium]
MTGEPSHRTAIITGASRGLGLALARRLAEDGWALIIDARGEEALENVRAELARHTHVVAIPGDVADRGHRAAIS